MCSPFNYSQRELAIAYSAGYEAGHHDTVEGVFGDNGNPAMHDEAAWEWAEEAKSDGTFQRELDL